MAQQIIERREIFVDGTWLKKNLCYNFTEVKKIDDLKKKIASELKIKIGDFSFVNVNPEKAFTIKEKLIIKFTYLPNDIHLHLKYLPTEKIIEVKNGTKKKIEEIIGCIQDKGIFYSKKCLSEAIDFDISSIENSKKGSLLHINVNKKVKDLITIKFYDYFISFAEYETIKTAQEEIKNALNKKSGEPCNILIKEGKKVLDSISYLKPKGQYMVECVINFQLSTEKKYPIKLPQAYSETVLNVKKNIMSMVIHKEVPPDNIILKKDGKEIKDDDKPLIEFGRNFDLVINNSIPEQPKIKINFVFEDNSEDKFDAFTDSFPENMLIGDLALLIRNKFKIKDKKINIDYQDQKLNCKNTIDKKMSIEDVLDEMKDKDKNGEIHNFLYIKTKKQALKGASAPKVTFLNKSDDQKAQQSAKTTKPVQPSKQHPPEKQQPPAKSSQPPKAQQSSKSQAPAKSPQPPKTQQPSKSQPLSKSKNPSKPENAASKKTDFIFIYEGNEEKIQVQADSLLKDNEQQIRKVFDIDGKLELEFKIVSNDSDEIDIDINSPMDKLGAEKVIKVYIHGKPNTYYFKANTSDDLCQIELETGATVRDLKRAIAKQNKVNNLARIKIIFAGKDLVDDIVLDELEVNNVILFVYIQSQEDILLLSAKAFHIDEDDDEYDFGEDDDDDDEDN